MRSPMHPPVTAAQVRELLATHASVHLPSGEEVHARPDAARFLDALAEVSFLVSHGDRRLAQNEMQCLVGTLSELSSGTIDRSALAGMIYEFSAALERDGLEARLSSLSGRFLDHQERLRLLAFGSLVAMCDRALQPGEREVLRTLAGRMGIHPDEIDACVDGLQKTMYEVSLPMRATILMLLGLFVAGCGTPPPPPKSTPKPAPKAEGPKGPARPVAPPLQGGSSDGASCEQVIDANNEELTLGKKQEADLSHADLGAVLNNGAYLNDCDVPDKARLAVCAAVKEGRAVGVTVAMSPSDPEVERCVAGKVRALGFPIHQKLHIARTTFE